MKNNARSNFSKILKCDQNGDHGHERGMGKSGISYQNFISVK